MPIFLEGEIVGGDVNKPRVLITRGNEMYKGKTITCIAGNSLKNVRKVAVIIAGNIKKAFSQIAGANPAEIVNQSETIKKRKKKKPKIKSFATLKVLFHKREFTGFPTGFNDVFSVTYFIGGDRTTPINLITTNKKIEEIEYFQRISFNNVGVDNFYVGLKYAVDDFSGANSSENIGFYNTIFLKDKGKDNDNADISEQIDQISYLSIPDYEEYISTRNDFYVHTEYINTFEWNFYGETIISVITVTTGDTFSNNVSTTTDSSEYSLKTYKNIQLNNESVLGNFVTLSSTNNPTTYTESPFKFLVLPPNILGEYEHPTDQTLNDSVRFNIYFFNDKKTKSFGVYSDAETPQEYRLYNSDLTYKVVTPTISNNQDITVRFDLKNANFIGDKIYVADDHNPEIDDVIGADFYGIGKYISSQEYTKWDTKTPVIVRVYEFQPDPDINNPDNLILVEIDAFTHEVERLTPASYDVTDTGSSGGSPGGVFDDLYYAPLRISYHPG